MAHTYCMDENQWRKAIAPVKPSLFIGPSKDCERGNKNMANQNSHNVSYSTYNTNKDQTYYQPNYQIRPYSQYYY
jgi:hypothetical protein